MKIVRFILPLVLICLSILACKKKDEKDPIVEEAVTYFDVHCHLRGQTGYDQFDFLPAAADAINYMEKWHIGKMIIMPPPFSNQDKQDGKRYDIDEMNEVLNQYPNRFYFLGGGMELNLMIQQDVTGEFDITPEQFKIKARAVSELDGFIGFGELTALHFALGQSHVYQQADPDHELFFALVDVAAEKNVPIDIHLEAVPDTMPFPDLVNGQFEQNPTTLYPNIARFETLLNYAQTKNVKIIWDHVGWDNTLKFTSALCQEMLTNHSNLYFSIKVSPDDTPVDNRVVDANGNLKQEWLDLFTLFPTRFMLGADHFHAETGTAAAGPPSMDETWSVLDQLPDNLKKSIGYQNAKTVFGI